ncbi:hypothetical protein ACEUZ9_005419 [Paracoccus litorisediminis]|jgi:hypothetical protein|uniref:hypothetical protein n=1 Tax=Paracoccus litorisediminis TaxID=2006130 RepID=UPI001FEBD6B4|nr:hypothetical protein [Paracoccus litorisediminis]
MLASNGACPLETAHHHQDVQRLAIAGIGIDQQQAGTGDLADKEADILDGDQSQIGQGALMSAPGQLQPLEPGQAGLKCSLPGKGTGL